MFAAAEVADANEGGIVACSPLTAQRPTDTFARMKNLTLILPFMIIPLFVGCGEDSGGSAGAAGSGGDSGSGGSAGAGGSAATPIPIKDNAVTVENASFNSHTGKGYINLFDGFAYAGQNATDNADKIDFRHQYRGVDIGNRRIFENMTSKGRWDVLSLFDGITPTESQVGPTTLLESQFDAIDNQQELIASFDFTSVLNSSVRLTDIDDNILAQVFAFTDKNGKRGLFKVISADTAPINTVVRGNLTIQIKVEQ